MSAAGALVGALLGGGVLLAATGAAARRPMSLADRVAPYLEGPSRTTSRHAHASTWSRLVGPSLLSAARRLDGVLGGSDPLRRRLEAAGRTDTDPLAFRVEQLLWALVAILVSGVALTLLAVSGRAGALVPSTVLVLLSGLLAALVRDRMLSRYIARRRDSIRLGLPAVADLLALAVAAGESPAAALDRVARLAHGPLALECRRACDDTASGVPFAEALDSMAARVDVPAVRRFVDGVVIAVQRGTPLAEVLRAQAGDARADLHRALLESAGRKEVLMLMPVVFLVLPTVVLVALFPAFASLSRLAP
jgi:tight adherence protein C